MSETRTPRLAVSPELQKARDGIEILRDMILATAHGQTHREAMHAAILDIAPFLEERSEPAAASVPLLIDQLADRLEDWAQNEEMIDQFFLAGRAHMSVMIATRLVIAGIAGALLAGILRDIGIAHLVLGGIFGLWINAYMRRAEIALAGEREGR
jgi:hypothetical protein